jgi:hypothetical protein
MEPDVNSVDVHLQPLNHPISFRFVEVMPLQRKWGLPFKKCNYNKPSL